MTSRVCRSDERVDSGGRAGVRLARVSGVVEQRSAVPRALMMCRVLPSLRLRSWSLVGATLLVAACSSGSGSRDGGTGGSAGSASAGTGGTGGANGGSGGANAGTGGASAGTGGGGVAGSTGGTGGGRGGGGGASAGSGGAAGRGGGGGGGTTGSGGAAGATGQATVYVGGSSSTISILALDLATGALTSRGTAPGGTSPTYLAWDGGQRFLYAGNGGQGRITSFRIEAAGALTSLGDVSTAGMIGNTSYMAAVTHISVHPTGSWVFTAHFDSGHIVVSPVGATGAAAGLVDIERPANQAHQIVSDASGRHVFVPCRSGNVIAQYGFDSTSGQLAAANPPLVQAATGAGPRHIAFHPNQQSAYVINELNGTITSYRYDATAGLLSSPETISAVPGGMNETSSAHVVVHPSGKFVYASNRTTNTIAMFSVDAQSGRLTTIGHETGGGMVRTPRDFGMEPGGRFLLVANQGTNNVLVFRIDATAGTLTRVGDPLSVPASPQFAGALSVP
jgi:6-phosphogluconolactonase